MEFDLDTGRLLVFSLGLISLALLERLVACRAPTTSTARRITLHVAVAIVNTTLTRMLVYVPLLIWIVYVEQMGWGIARWVGLDGWPEFLLSILVLDAFDYLWHRANHRIPFLWRFHKAHHSDNDLDVFTALRFHPGELIISAGVKASWVVVWGPSAIAWFLFEAMVSFCAQMHHSNIDLPDQVERSLARILVTPRFHAAHHLVERDYGDCNFSTIFSFWDHFFGTLAPWLSHADLKARPMGLPEGRAETLSFSQLLLEPVKSRNFGLADQRHS